MLTFSSKSHFVKSREIQEASYVIISTKSEDKANQHKSNVSLCSKVEHEPTTQSEKGEHE